MNTKLISNEAIAVINQYKNFQVGNAVCSVPYYNNKVKGTRAGLRVEVGKGSPREIFDEVKAILIKERVLETEISSEQMKQLLVNHNIGIDCSGFAYYVLDIKDRRLHFPFAKGIFGRLKAKLRPIENTDVATLAHDSNSKMISIHEAQPGDIITMIGKDRDHILIVNQIEYQNFKPVTLHYVHAVAWPTDGEYGHGIHEGKIEIIDINKTLTGQRWVENDKTGIENHTFSRASNSQTELRRLAFL